MRNSATFTTDDADAYFTRNRDVLTPQRAATDPMLRLLEEMGILATARRVLEPGCANGWRLAAIKERYPHIDCVGLEPSKLACAAAKQFPNITVMLGAIDGPVQAGDGFDIAIMAFVFHWINPHDRQLAFENLDCLLAMGGALAIMDFLPYFPHVVPYHHRRGVFTHKTDYGAMGSIILGYPVIAQRLFDYDIPSIWCDTAPNQRRCGVQILRKPA